MSTKPGARRPSVQVNEHSGFALELADYLNHLRYPMSNREFASRAAEGTYEHWGKIFSRSKVMTTNDVKMAADVFGMTPYEFVAGAREYASNVTAHPEDYEQGQWPQGDFRLAAKKERPDNE